MAVAKIVLTLEIQQCEDLSIIDELVENIKELEKEFNNEINLSIVDCERPFWRTDLVEFEDLLDIPIIIGITELWIPKKKRNKGYASKILNCINDTIGKSAIIFAKAGIMYKEYPTKKWSIKNESGKQLIPVAEVLGNQASFWSNRGFMNINELIGYEQFSMIHIYNNPLGMVAKQYMESYLVLKGRIPFNRVKNIYKSLIQCLLSFNNDKDIVLYPWNKSKLNEFRIKEKAATKIPDNIINELLLKSKIWFSEYEGLINDIYTSNMIHANRTILTEIGGAEVVLNKYKNIIASEPAVLINVSDNVKYINLFDDDGLSYEDSLSLYLMEGFALYSDGFWIEKLWHYDFNDNVVIDEKSEDNNKPIAYVGFIKDIPELH